MASLGTVNDSLLQNCKDKTVWQCNKKRKQNIKKCSLRIFIPKDLLAKYLALTQFSTVMCLSKKCRIKDGLYLKVMYLRNRKKKSQYESTVLQSLIRGDLSRSAALKKSHLRNWNTDQTGNKPNDTRSGLKISGSRSYGVMSPNLEYLIGNIGSI